MREAHLRGFSSQMAAMPASATVGSQAAVPTVATDSPERHAIQCPEWPCVAQGTEHGHALVRAMSALRLRFRHRRDVLVPTELAVYYKPGASTPWCSRIFRCCSRWRADTADLTRSGRKARWRNFVRGVALLSTAGRDLRHRAPEYARVGVRECWLLDPEGWLMDPALEGYAVPERTYDPVVPVQHGAGCWAGPVQPRERRGDGRSVCRQGFLCRTIIPFLVPKP